MKLIDLKEKAKSLGLSDEKIRQSAFIHRLLPLHAYWNPIAFTIAITTYCNLKCPMCTRTIYGIEPKHMDLHLFKNAVKFFKGKTINIVGGGEPFMHPLFFEIMGICRDSDVGIHLVTNGTMLDLERAIELMKFRNLQSVAFSIDSVKDYKRVRINGELGTVITNLKRVYTFKRALQLRNHKSPSIIINSVGMRSTIEGFPDLVSELGEYVDSIQLIHPLTYTPEMAQEHLHQDPLKAMVIFDKSEQIAKSMNIKLKLPSLMPRARGCAYPWMLPVIDINGDVYPCHMYGGEAISGVPMKETYGKSSMICNPAPMKMGKIVDFDKLWNGKVITELRRKLRKVNIADLEHRYSGDDYEEQIKLRGSEFYCEVCPSRWDSAC